MGVPKNDQEDSEVRTTHTTAVKGRKMNHYFVYFLQELKAVLVGWQVFNVLTVD